MQTKKHTFYKRSAWRRWAPIAATAAVLVVIIADGGMGVAAGRPDGAEAYFQHVGQQIDKLPMRLGRWLGKDVEPTQAARKLLDPNRIVQRRYANPDGGPGFSLLVVHCGDTRDMQGHYPRNCYRNAGWTIDAAEPVELQLGEETAPAMRYKFSRMSGVVPDQMVVHNFFAIPGADNAYTNDIGEVNRASRGKRRAGLGAAQVQIITAESTGEDVRAEMLAAVAQALAPVAEAVAGGPDKLQQPAVRRPRSDPNNRESPRGNNP